MTIQPRKVPFILVRSGKWHGDTTGKSFMNYGLADPLCQRHAISMHFVVLQGILFPLGVTFYDDLYDCRGHSRNYNSRNYITQTRPCNIQQYSTAVKMFIFI